MLEIIASIIGGLLVGSVLTFFYFHKNHVQGISGESKALIEKEYLKGKIDGAKEELNKFQIHYQPVIVDDDGLFSHKFDAGYEMQLLYSGLPIGDATRRITHHEEKAKEENINKVISAITNGLALLAGEHKIPISVAEKPITSKK